MSDFWVRKARWDEDHAGLRAVRYEVFVSEQKVPEEIEVDEQDALALHVLAEAEDGQAIGTGRLLMDEARIGRMAVLLPWRRRGVGGAMLRFLLEEARAQGLRDVRLHAQVSAMPFYERFGFAGEGEEFTEAGIPHRTMRLRLRN